MCVYVTYVPPHTHTYIHTYIHTEIQKYVYMYIVNHINIYSQFYSEPLVVEPPPPVYGFVASKGTAHVHRKGLGFRSLGFRDPKP